MSIADGYRRIAELRTTDAIVNAVAAPRRRDDLDVETPFVAPATAREIQLAGMWREVLGLDQIGVDDNFFELGGDSLGVVQVLVKIHAAWGVTIPIEDFYEQPAIRPFVAVIDTAAL